LPDVAANLRIVTDVTGSVQVDPDVDALIGELRLIRAAAVQAAAGDTSPAEPKAYLTSWREILDALHRKNNPTERQTVSKLNKEQGGPIIVSGRGKQPFVERVKLRVWWDGLEGRFQELQQRHRDKQATTADQYSYGNEGTVVPEIGGSAKKRRRDAKR
jgi:hypothetical protein